MSFADIPSDIFSLIVHHSDLKDIARLCRISRRYLEYVQGDKRLWLERLQKDVICKGIELPKYCQHLERASAEAVRSLVKNAIALNRAYASGGQSATVNSFVVDDGLEATWTKIVRGRWCLVALSNVSTSFVGVWQIQSTGSLELANRFFLPGPVLDGVVDDVTDEIRIAITVATTNPYIQVIMLGIQGATMCLKSLQSLEGARHVLLLNGFVVGYKTLHGDDTYPLLTDWRTGATVKLYPAIYSHRPNELLGDIHSPCHAMGVWKNTLFIVFNYSVEIFSLPSFDFLSAYHVGAQSLCFPALRTDMKSQWIGEAYIFENGQVPGGLVSDSTHQSLRFSVRDLFGMLYIRAIVQMQDGSFSWDNGLCRELRFDAMSYRHCVSASSEYQLRLASEDSRDTYPAFLDLIRHPHSPAAETGVQFGDRQKFIISTPNLPILDLTTAMDFDDAAGIILLGSCRGEISTIQFVDKSFQTPGSLLDGLPVVLYELPDIQTSPIPMDLPHCYHFPDKIREGAVPAIVLEEAIDRWDKASAFPKIDPPPGWSSDWKQNRSIHNWVFPFPRWRTLAVDQEFHYQETWIRILQSTLGHGDIIPVLYHKDNHDLVIFRIAARLYYFLRGPPLDEHEHRIRALPFSVQDLSNPYNLAHLWRSRWRNGSLSNRDDSPALILLSRTQECLSVLDYLKTDSGRKQLSELSLSDDLNSWSLDERRKIYRKARDRWRAAHKRMNAEQDYDAYV